MTEESYYWNNVC